MAKENFDLLGRIVNVLTTIPNIWGVLVDLCEKLASSAGAEWLRELAKFLRKEPTWICRWYEKDGIIYFDVILDGTTTDSQWIKRLEGNGFQLSKQAKEVLNSSDFRLSKAGTYKVAVLKGTLFTSNERTTSKILAKAEELNLGKPNADIACIIREMFSDEELEAMGLWGIATFHETINDFNGVPRLLYASRDSDGRWLGTCCARPDWWNSGDGFAFLASEVSLD